MKIKIIFLLIPIVIYCILAFPPTASACTYEATITGDHVDFVITSDLDKLILIQYIRQSGLALVTKMSGPSVGTPWKYFDDPVCNVYVDYPVGCRQNRGLGLGTGAFWQWSANGYAPYNRLPSGIWGLDFDSTPTYNSIGIQYATPDNGGTWTSYCQRTGDISVSPAPITKTVFIPGLGASWNEDAFAGCTFDNDPAHWSLSTYAESVYNPILSALSESGLDIIPFYYDWRQQIPSNSTALSDKIDSSTTTDEKVNIVGHSMGGLVASEYLVNHDHGTKINSLLTVGSPLKGAIQAYPAWAGGDIWEDNFVTKIAMTLYLKHCGLLLSNREAIHQFVPSVQNLLPTFNYLRDSKTGELKTTSSLSSQNGWLPLNFANDFWSVKFGTLTGTGQNTLSEILIKGKTKKDLSANWLDGKPEAGIYSSEGDGTVLLSSSKWDDEHNVTLNQNHSGLMNSVDGMTEILRFFDKPLPNSLKPGTSGVNSALVVIGYPSSFWITSQDGKTQKDKDGMVSFINPKSGSYKVNLIPKGSNTLFIVAQFLPNGEVKYKEYNLTGFGPKFKTLKFDLQNPAEDILN